MSRWKCIVRSGTRRWIWWHNRSSMGRWTLRRCLISCWNFRESCGWFFSVSVPRASTLRRHFSPVSSIHCRKNIPFFFTYSKDWNFPKLSKNIHLYSVNKQNFLIYVTTSETGVFFCKLGAKVRPNFVRNLVLILGSQNCSLNYILMIDREKTFIFSFSSILQSSFKYLFFSRSNLID